MKFSFKNLKKFLKNLDNLIFLGIVIGISFLTIGIFLLGFGINKEIGANLIIVGSGMFYISTVVLVFRI